ncbi:MAG: hypothetical protein AAB336_11110 [Acidobacteriota bacterium]
MKKIVSFMLIGLILNSVFYVSSANGATVPNDSSKEAKMTTKLKMELNKIGIGNESKVEVKLNDGTKVSGYLSEINDDDFVVVAKNDDSKRIRYDTVRKAKGRHRHHRFALSASILGLVLGVLALALSGNSNSRY